MIYVKGDICTLPVNQGMSMMDLSYHKYHMCVYNTINISPI